jgi:hypothetical protein
VNGRLVHAVVAAGLADPRLLAKWSRGGQDLVARGIDPAAIDLAALRKFAGLTTSIRHNGLRRDFPETFRLLSLARLEIDLFADYAMHLAEESQRLAATPAERADDLIAFLERWIDPHDRAHRLVLGLARHEAALLKMSGPMDFTPEPPASRLPTIRGKLLLAPYEQDPRDIAAAEDGLLGAAARHDEVLLAYWRQHAEATLRIATLDAFTYELLLRTDGSRTVAELAVALTGTEPDGQFLAGLGAVTQLGLIAWCAT